MPCSSSMARDASGLHVREGRLAPRETSGRFLARFDRRHLHPNRVGRTFAAVPGREQPFDQLVARDRPRDLVRQASELSELERAALAHALAGWSTGEAATRLGLPRRSTDNALKRAKRRLHGWQERWAA